MWSRLCLSTADENFMISGAFASQMKFCVGAAAPLGYRLRGRTAIRRGLSAGWRLMASKTEETPQKEEMEEKEGPETLPDSPLLDLSDAAVKKLIRSAKKRGYVTHDQINSVLRSEEVNSEQIEDVLAMFSEMGIVAIPILSGLHHHYIRI
jgi:hypothetical protein